VRRGKLCSFYFFFSSDHFFFLFFLNFFHFPSFLHPQTRLLGNIGTAVMMEKDQGVDPAQLISKIPMGMRVPGLRDKLVKIISDYTMQLQLRESCNLVLKADCFELLKKLCYQQRRAMRVVSDPVEIETRQRLQSAASSQRETKLSHRGSPTRHRRNQKSRKDSLDFGSGGPRRSTTTSLGTEAEMYSGGGGGGDGATVQVSFSDKICYPWESGHHHTTRQPVGVSGTEDSSTGGGEALPRFG
jgi:hypothetical protein